MSMSQHYDHCTHTHTTNTHTPQTHTHTHTHTHHTHTHTGRREPIKLPLTWLQRLNSHIFSEHVCVCVCVYTLSLTVLQSNGIFPFLTFVLFSPTRPSELLKTHLYKQYPPPPPHPTTISITFNHFVHLCVGVVQCAKNTVLCLYIFFRFYLYIHYC